ncbi:MAG TPA: helix-turn-helix domain-containing protein [Verrucomicrobiae bacterium]|nr:helix-turn-helix domain-containing protein [Verrucomicrobiae bacterium]
MEQECKEVIDGYNCGLGVALQLIGGKWKGAILQLLEENPHRFGELKRDLLGVSERILIKQLREMEQDGLILRRDFKSLPPKVEYSITPLGASLLEALCPLSEWVSSQTRFSSITVS